MAQAPREAPGFCATLRSAGDYPRIASAVSGPPMRDTLPGRVRWGMTVTAPGDSTLSPMRSTSLRRRLVGRAGDPRCSSNPLAGIRRTPGSEALTRELVRRMERDLELPLEWVAAAHFNTEHPHVHMLLRGIADGREVRLAPQYVRSGIRKHAEDLCNRATWLPELRRTAPRHGRRESISLESRPSTTPCSVSAVQSQAESTNADHFAVDVAGADGLVEQRLYVRDPWGWRSQSAAGGGR